MRKLEGYGVLDVLSPEVFSILQLCATTEPLFPNIKTLDLQPAVGSIPFIPLFLSPRTTTITIGFPHSSFPAAMVASIITTIPTLCPNLEDIHIHSLPRDPRVTTAASRMVLASNRNALRSFRVEFPLTEEACGVIYTHPGLRTLSMVIERDTSSPSVVLPNLTDLMIRYNRNNDWLRVFSGATFGSLEAVTFYSYSEQIGVFLETFERAALATSIQHTLWKFYLFTVCSWNPNYSSLHRLTQMTDLIVEFT